MSAPTVTRELAPAARTVTAMDLRDRRIFEARTAGLTARMVDAGFPPARAQELVDAWDTEATRRGLPRQSPGYWSRGAEWILAQPRRP